HFRAMLVVLILIALVAPLVIVLSLLLVALMMTPSIVNLVAERRFPLLERRRGAPFWQSTLWSLGATLLALLAIFVTMPLWLMPAPLVVAATVWLYTLVFAFSALWFAHYLLAALQAHRAATGGVVAEAAAQSAGPPVPPQPDVPVPRP